MAKQTLPTNFKDDILAPSMGGKRKFTITDNGDGTYSFEDVTDYTQTGSDFGAGQINATNQAVNESCDKANVIENMDDIMANQASGMIAGAKAVAELNGKSVLESGDNYRKWVDGTLEVWGRTPLSAISITAHSGILYNSPMLAVDFPVDFIEPPEVNADFANAGGVFVSLRGTYSTYFTYYLYADTEQARSGTLCWKATGKWK